MRLHLCLIEIKLSGLPLDRKTYSFRLNQSRLQVNYLSKRDILNKQRFRFDILFSANISMCRMEYSVNQTTQLV